MFPSYIQAIVAAATLAIHALPSSRRYWLPLYYIICQLGTLNVADCKWLVRSCRPLGTWRWYDDVHSTSEANWIGAMQVE